MLSAIWIMPQLSFHVQEKKIHTSCFCLNCSNGSNLICPILPSRRILSCICDYPTVICMHDEGNTRGYCSQIGVEKMRKKSPSGMPVVLLQSECFICQFLHQRSAGKDQPILAFIRNQKCSSRIFSLIPVWLLRVGAFMLGFSSYIFI